jgi:hypothetical protein
MHYTLTYYYVAALLQLFHGALDGYDSIRRVLDSAYADSTAVSANRTAAEAPEVVVPEVNT